LTSICLCLSVPYGWKNSSHYTIKQTKGSSDPLLLEGTLIASPFLDHSICLSDGTYVVTLDDVPENDDFLPNDDYYAGLHSEAGVEEYRIFFNQNRKLKMKASDKAIITVTGSTATIKIKHPSESDYELPVGGVIGVVLTSLFLLAALFLVFFDTATSLQRMKRFLGIATPEPDEGPLAAADGQKE
jgi:hypothetical protein